MSELRIKIRSESDLRSCEVTWAITKITAKITFTSMIVFYLIT